MLTRSRSPRKLEPTTREYRTDAPDAGVRDAGAGELSGRAWKYAPSVTWIAQGGAEPVDQIQQHTRFGSALKSTYDQDGRRAESVRARAAPRRARREREILGANRRCRFSAELYHRRVHDPDLMVRHRATAHHNFIVAVPKTNCTSGRHVAGIPG